MKKTNTKKQDVKKISARNYVILAVLLIATVFLTLLLSNIYISKTKVESDFYQYSNKIVANEFEEYVIENPDVIIYISDKYSLENKKQEKKLKEKIESLNLKDKLIFLEKEEVDKEFISMLNKKYKIDIEYGKLPYIIVLNDNEVSTWFHVDKDINILKWIDFEVFE